jgi:hypothetical protein
MENLKHGVTYCNVFRVVHVTDNYGIRRTIGFINTSVTHALLLTIKYQEIQLYS